MEVGGWQGVVPSCGCHGFVVDQHLRQWRDQCETAGLAGGTCLTIQSGQAEPLLHMRHGHHIKHQQAEEKSFRQTCPTTHKLANNLKVWFYMDRIIWRLCEARTQEFNQEEKKNFAKLVKGSF